VKAGGYRREAHAPPKAPTTITARTDNSRANRSPPPLGLSVVPRKVKASGRLTRGKAPFNHPSLSVQLEWQATLSASRLFEINKPDPSRHPMFPWLQGIHTFPSY